MQTQLWSSTIGQWSSASLGSSQAAVAEDNDAHRAWQRLIDQLQLWGSDRSQLADDGVNPPSAQILERALLLARQSQQRGLPPPSSIVPDANGGIVMERRDGDLSEAVYLWDDGAVEYQRFAGNKLVERRPL